MFLLILGFVLMLEGLDLNRLLDVIPDVIPGVIPDVIPDVIPEVDVWGGLQNIKSKILEVSDSLNICTTLEASAWGGKIQATYTDCTKYNIPAVPAAITVIVKVPEITNTEHCPLIKDWVISAVCPDGLFAVCTIKESFEISVDVCDMILKIATGEAAMAAKSASKALLNKLGSGIQWQQDMARKLVDNIGKEVVGVRQSNRQGLCDNIDPGIKDLLKCLFVNIDIDLPGLEAFLEIVSQSITSTVNVGMDFNIKNLQIENEGISIDLSANLDGLDSGAFTLMAKSDAFSSAASNCDNPLHMAKKMAASLKLTRDGFIGTFEITCEKVDLLPEEIGDLIKAGAETIQNSIANAPQNIKNALLNVKDKLSNVCETIKKHKNVCENVPKETCGWKWKTGRRELDQEANEEDGPGGRRNLRRKRWNLRKVREWACNKFFENVCKMKWVPVC